MRISAVQIRNFRCFEDERILLGPSTVLIGSNNAGKSTILDAIHCLFSARDRAGRLYTRSSVVRRSAPGSIGGEVRPREAVTVVAEVDDLSPDEVKAWGSFGESGHLLLGVYFPPEPERAFPVGPLRGSTSRSSQMLILPRRDLSLLSDESRGALMGSAELEDDRGIWVALHALGSSGGTDFIWDVPGGDDREIPYDEVPHYHYPMVLALPGPEVATPDPAVLLEPALERIVESMPYANPDLGHALTLVAAAADQAVEAIRSGLDAAVRSMMPGTDGVDIARSAPWPDSVAAAALRAGIGNLSVIVRDLGAPERTGDPVSEFSIGPGRVPISVLGAGSRRVAALAALRVYGDADVWPPDRPILITVEEPEVGLHPAAQRQVARFLKQMSRFSVQTVLVTHSPVFVNAAGIENTRVVSRSTAELSSASRVMAATDAAEIIDSVGARPSDVLLARAFAVVEGQTETGVFPVWCRKLGFDTEDAGLRFIAAEGWSKADLVSRILNLAMDRPRLWVILDREPRAARPLEALREAGDQVATVMLTRTEIEKYYAPAAVARWLAGHVSGFDKTDASSLFAQGVSVETLNAACRRLLRRGYSKTADGPMIAGSMTEAEIDPEIKSLLTSIAASLDEARE